MCLCMCVCVCPLVCDLVEAACVWLVPAGGGLRAFPSLTHGQLWDHTLQVCCGVHETDLASQTGSIPRFPSDQYCSDVV